MPDLGRSHNVKSGFRIEIENEFRMVRLAIRRCCLVPQVSVQLLDANLGRQLCDTTHNGQNPHRLTIPF